MQAESGRCSPYGLERSLKSCGQTYANNGSGTLQGHSMSDHPVMTHIPSDFDETCHK